MKYKLKISHVIISFLFVISFGFNYLNYQSNNELRLSVKHVDERITLSFIEKNFTKNPHNFLHKVVAKETLRKYSYVLNKPDYVKKTKNPYPNKIWIFWNNGFKNAPDLVHVCLNSIKKHLPEKEVILLDENNIGDYIKIPQYILEKYKKGIICPAHFSDIVRVYLLRDYGGLWMDATIFLSGKLPKDILNADFFAPSLCDINPKKHKDFQFKNLVLPGAFCNHFMYAANPHNYIFECMARFLNEYWKDKDWADYFLFYEFTAIALEEDKKFFNILLETFKNHYYAEKPFLNLNSVIDIDEQFDETVWNKIKEFPIHKICNAGSWKKRKIKEGSFAEKLLSGKLD